MRRRRFLARCGLAGAALAAPAYLPARSLDRRVVVAVVGVNGRGSDHVRGFSALEGAQVGFVCDVDERALARGIQAVSPRQGAAPAGLGDFRRALDDRGVDAVSIATPDHWHAPAAILAAAAGKHVYLEKPGSHNVREAQLLAAAAKKFKRVIHLGTQYRSASGLISALGRLHAGELGRAIHARAWYSNSRPSIGRGKVAPVPQGLDFDLWQGPAPQREHRDNILHYNWHWFWHWGTGELGNNGVHALDICRWGLQVDHPLRVTAAGGRYRHEDDQETPDTLIVTFEFAGKMIHWEGNSCQPHGHEGSGFGASFLCERGSLTCDGNNCVFRDASDKEVERLAVNRQDSAHYESFLSAVRDGTPSSAPIEDSHRSAVLCHLGNIAWRTGRVLQIDPATCQPKADRDAEALLGREYRPGWEPRV